MMGDFLCVGDHISLYCEETEGYVYNWQSSSAHNGLFIYQWQDRDKPANIPSPQAVQFQVCIQNRYKLNKKYRKLIPQTPDGEPVELAQYTLDQKTLTEQAKMAAKAENDDNVAEQRRQHAKGVKYGEVIQLKHVFTQKFIHVSTTQTSRRDKNNMLVHLQECNAKHAMFRILPRYKVKSEGEFVQIYDQIILESLKSPGQYWHASTASKIDHFSVGSELNLGIQAAGFTVVKNFRPAGDEHTLLKNPEWRQMNGGSTIRLFHKELEAYLVAEGLFDEKITEDVHLRIREVNQLIPRSLYASTSANTYWQIEAESSIVHGEVIRWEQQVRFRHLCTRQYLCITADRKVSLTSDAIDPRTVFRLHPVMKPGDQGNQTDDVQFGSFARIENVITAYWLHALKDESYLRSEIREAQEEAGDSMKSLRWDGADLRKISASGEKMYHDAYTLQAVEEKHLNNFNFVAGMVPFLLNLILDRKEGKTLNAKKTHMITLALDELKDFMIVKGVATKERQKLMRNLRVIDILVALLQCPLHGTKDQTHLTRVFKSAYNVLYTYLVGNSKKNSLYCAKYIDFFQTQISVELGDIGLNVAKMIVELIRDNRKIVDRVSQEQIEMFVSLLTLNKNYRYLDLLNVLCVCDGVGIADNQSYIAEHWLRRDKTGMRYLTERGQNVNGQPNIIYLSTDNGRTWIPLHEFVDPEKLAYAEEEVMFFNHQLDLFGKLAHGRNDFSIFVMTRELGILIWDEAFLSLRSTLLPDALRAKYCELVILLFIDVGTNYSVLEHSNLSFIYEDVLVGGPNQDGEFVKKSIPAVENWLAPEGIIKDLVALFPVIRDWIAAFLEENTDMTASMVGRNKLIEQVLRLFHFLVKFGYYSSDNIKTLLNPLINLLNGRLDKPFPPDTEKGGFTKDSMKLVNSYRQKERYLPSPETEAIVNAKYQAEEVLDLLLTFQFNSRLDSFIAKFKTAETTATALKQKERSVLCPLLYDMFDPFDQDKNALKTQKKALKDLRVMFDQTSYFDSEQITQILMDLSNYQYDKMVNKSLCLLNKYYSSKTKLFKMADQAMVLITTDSCHTHREIVRTLPILRRYANAKINADQEKTMGAVLDRYAEFCHLPKDESKRHPMNQNILINHEVLSLVFDMLSQKIDAKLLDQYRGQQEILKKSLKLLKSLAQGNNVVQMRMFERLDSLLKIKSVESDLAVALQEIFSGNQVTCLKIVPQQIQIIVDLAACHQEKAPEFLDLLNVVVKVEGQGITLKRNQAYVMKYIMQDYNKLAYVLDQPRDFREKLLTMKSGKDHLAYYINFIDLLATCAEGENRFIESMCQTILTVDELMWVINHHEVDNNLKKPFLRYFLWVYMKTAGSAVESGAGDLPHDGNMWKFLQQIATDAHELTEYISRNQAITTNLLKKSPSKTECADPGDLESVVYCNIHYFFDAVLPVVQAFYTQFYIVDKYTYPQEVENTDKLARALTAFCEAAIPLISSPSHIKAIISVATAVIPLSTIPNRMVNGLLAQMGHSSHLHGTKHTATKGHKEYYQAEMELNAKLKTFAKKCSLVYGGHNTVQVQLKYKSKREYMEIGGDEELPLGEEFQEHLKRFIKPHEKKVPNRLELVSKLVHQLQISTRMYEKLATEAQRLEQEELDIRCLQLIRALIHNDERKLPENWEENPSDHKKQLQLIRLTQNELNRMNAVVKALPHLARPSDRIAKEVLAFLCIMLFNANEEVQSSMLKYFLHTREESFFAAIRARMHLSSLAIKEKRSLAAQQESRAREVLAQANSMQTTMVMGMGTIERKEVLASRQRGKEAKKKKLSKKIKKKKESKLNGFTNDKMKDQETLISDEQIEMESVQVSVEGEDENQDNSLMSALREEELAEIDQKDDGYIELVLRVLARICDGQHRGLQDYLREQPDNLKSFNIVAETAQFVNLVYSNINPQNIDLVSQLYATLNEFSVGNPLNRSVMLNSKVIDYINFILRAGEFEGCDSEKVLELKQCIGNLLLSMIEESSPTDLQVAKEIKDTLDKEAVYRCMTSCYEMLQPDRPNTEGGVKGTYIGMTLRSVKDLAQNGKKMIKGKNNQETLSAEMKRHLDQVGFSYYLVLARMHDVDPTLATSGEINITPLQYEAFNHYKKNTMSIEIIKDGHLQKVNFRVKNKNELRDEVKEKMIWSVDRSSPSNKIRDFMKWSKDILTDMYYQRKILSNPLAKFLTKKWLFWNQMCILLSLAINILMLVTWGARASLMDTPVAVDATAVPDAIYDPRPVVKLKDYDLVIYGLGGFHNLFSLLVLITYFLSNHPILPNFSNLKEKIAHLCNKEKKTRKEKLDLDKLDQNQQDHRKKETKDESKLEVKFLSFTTFYYMVFLGFSIGGTLFQGYFFAFHLLNIVNNNQLLKGVIQAVTQNGKSLLWVAVLGFVVFYLYALISFALLRSSFDPAEGLYCSTLWQCTITVVRYGLIGDIFGFLDSHPAENSFLKFGLLVVYHLSFFIFVTTIGLNIIFGIIVDTFSELRDLKWTAEKDMRDTCFICSRGSYDFEHYGKGFDQHINREHHIWAYIFFFTHLHDTKKSDYTALDLYVHKLLSAESYDFFPLNRALSLSAMDEDSTESKVDDLLRHVLTLVERQREQDQNKKRDDERRKHLQWREEHRNALLKGPDTPYVGRDDVYGDINQSSSFTIPDLQNFSDKTSQPGIKRGPFQDEAFSVVSQDSNFNLNRLRDFLKRDDPSYPHGPGGKIPPHKSTVDQTGSAEHSLDMGRDMELRSPDASTSHTRTPEALDPSLGASRGPMHLIEFGDEAAAGSDEERHLMMSSPTNDLSDSQSSLSRKQRTPSPPGAKVADEPESSTSIPRERTSSGTLPEGLPHGPSPVDMAIQVGFDPERAVPETPPRLSRPPSRQTSSFDLEGPRTPSRSSLRDHDYDHEDPDASFSSSLRSSIV